MVRTIHDPLRARLLRAGSGLAIREGSGITIARHSPWPRGTRAAGTSLAVLLRSNSRTQPGASQVRVIGHTTRLSGQQRIRDWHRAGGRSRAGQVVRIGLGPDVDPAAANRNTRLLNLSTSSLRPHHTTHNQVVSRL